MVAHFQNGNGITIRDLNVYYRTFNPVEKIARHHHQHGIFCVMLRGHMGEVADRNREREFGAGSLIYRCPDDQHRNYFGKEGAVKFSMAPTSDRPLKMLAQAGFKAENIFSRCSGLCMALALRICRELRNQDASTPLVIEGLALEMLGEACRLERQFPRGGAPPWLMKVRARIHEEFCRSLTVAQYAEGEGVHPIHLAQTFRSVYGITLGRYVRRLRVDRAANLLAETRTPVVDIALACGFYDQAHFSRVFKQHTGQTPSAYRRLAGKDN